MAEENDEKTTPNYKPPIIIKQSSYALIYRPEFAAQLLAHIRGGLTFESFDTDPPTSKKSHYNWMKEHPEFAEAREMGERFFLRMIDRTSAALATGVYPEGKEDQIKRADGPMLRHLADRRYPDVYKNKVHNIHQNPDGSKLETKIIFEEVNGKAD
jgi:hypothetical protein